MGVLGAGGAILLTPIMVYKLHWPRQTSISSTLLVIYYLSFIGACYAAFRKEIHWSSIMIFGIPSVLAVGLTKYFIVPLIADMINRTKDNYVTKDNILLLLFAFVLMYFDTIIS
ncbi:MAG: TSUP family transporter [Saprospiraceae bacterium]|nr:TSUP family transporter [Saprospiraceae bacterium]